MNNPQSLIADVARRYLHVRETSKNQSSDIAKFWDATWYKEGDDNREPWCVSSCVYWIQQADKESSDIQLRVPPRMASVSEFEKWATDPKNGCLTFEWKKVNSVYIPQRGDIVTFHFKTGTHIGVVDSAPFSKPTTGETYIKTIEGNTSSGELGSQRDGDGVFERDRSRPICGLFVRLPTRPKIA
jgi:CHAP domain